MVRKLCGNRILIIHALYARQSLMDFEDEVINYLGEICQQNRENYRGMSRILPRYYVLLMYMIFVFVFIFFLIFYSFCLKRLGAHYRLWSSIGTEQDFDVIRIIQHEDYYYPNSYSNDIALLRLSRPAVLGKGVGLICLSNANFQLPFDNSNKPCWITGWGTIYYSGPQPNALMQVDLPLVSKQRCLNYYPGKIDDSMICIGKAQGGQGACHGDSGGPLVCEFGGKWYLEGAASWTGLPCASPLKPTVYANVRNLKSWIINKMNGASGTV